MRSSCGTRSFARHVVTGAWDDAGDAPETGLFAACEVIPGDTREGTRAS